MTTAPLESDSPDETLDIGRQLATMLRGGEVVLLQGPMGSGKSVLTRGIVSGLGGAEWRGSPSFTIVNEYGTSPMVHHADLYRLDTYEVGALGLDEYVGPDSVLVVEWPQRARDYLASLAHGGLIEIELVLTGRSQRRITAAGLSQPLFGHHAL